METFEMIAVAEIHTEATLNALNAALEAARIDTNRILAIHLLPGIHATVGRPVPDKYRVLYRR